MQRRDFLKFASTVTAYGLLPGLSFADSKDLWATQFQQALASKPWLGNLLGVDQSLSASKLKVQGKIPKALSGVFYRNGPTQHQVSGQRYHHLFDGDGMVHRFVLDGESQSANHIGRFVDTPKRRLDLEHGKIAATTFGTSLEQMLPSESADAINAANISVRHHAGRLMALWEAGSAHELEPDTLETLGKISWSEDLAAMPFSAHPKVDQDGSLWNFGAIGVLNGLILYHIDAGGKLKQQQVIELPEARMVHDFMITETHLVFVLPPFAFDRKRAESDETSSYLDLHNWRPDQPSWLLLVDKNQLSSHRLFELPAAWVFHFGNAWEEKNTLHFDMCRYDNPGVMTHAMRELMRGEDRFDLWANNTKVQLNTQTGEITQQSLYTGVDFPVYDERFIGQKNRYTLAVCNHKAEHFFGANRLVMMDLKEGKHRHFDYPDNEIIEEHVFVPSPNSDKEIYGWLIGTSFDFKRQISKVNIFVSERFSEGPEAVVELPYIIPAGFHGTFVKS